MTASQNGGRLVTIFHENAPQSADVSTDGGGATSVVGVGPTAAPDLGTALVTLVHSNGTSRNAIVYAGANTAGAECVFGFTLFSP